MVFSVTYASSPILSPVGSPRLFQSYLTETQCAGFEPTRRINARRLSKPFQYHYGNTAKWKVSESNRPHGLLVHLTVIAALRYTFPCAFPCSTSEVEHGVFYLRRASASHLLVRRYLTSWGREELNLQCLPHRNRFTVCRNTANRCRFPKTGIAGIEPATS